MAELVGILNITPDSFSDGNQNNSNIGAITKAQDLYADGASIVDIGAESTRPGATAITWQEEVARLNGFIVYAKNQHLHISLDTYHPQTVAWASSKLPDFIINDVTGFRDPAMRDIAAQIGARVIASHLPMQSKDIQTAHQDKLIDSVDQVIEELHISVEALKKAGVLKENIIVDPGIGFGKTKNVNWELLMFGQDMPEHDVMIGYSRKRFLGQDHMKLDTNLFAGQIAITAGAKYLRVHDVKGHMQLIQ